MKNNHLLLFMGLFLVICAALYFSNEKETNEKEQSTVIRVIHETRNNHEPNHNYQQVGILTPTNNRETNNILQLMGRVLYNRRDLWNYYTISNQHNNVKLPITVKGKSALSERGVDQIYNGDTVYVEGANEVYKATIYDNETMRYLPSV